MASPYLQTSSGSIAYSSATNWSTLTAPAAGDSVAILNSSATIDGGLLNTDTLASLSVPLTFTGTCGIAAQATKSVTGITRSSSTATATTSAAHGYAAGDTVVITGSGGGDYDGTFTLLTASGTTFTYTVAGTPTTPATGTILCRKNDYLIQPATLVSIGAAGNNTGTPANGSGRFKLNTGTAQATVTVYQTSQSAADTNFEPVRLLGSHASNTLNMLGGLVGLATTTVAETATFATINQTGGTLNGGIGLTWSAVTQSGGTLKLNSGAASGTVTNSRGATTYLAGAGTIANLNIGGTCYLDIRKATSGDTITGAVTLYDGAVLYMTGNPSDVSFASLVVYGNATIVANPANPGHVSWSSITRNAGSTLTQK
jgi:hypothetical protein